MKVIVTLCLFLSLTVTPCFAATAEMIQAPTVSPLSVTAIGEVAPILQAIMASNMDPAQKERSIQIMVELTRFQIEQGAKATESMWQRIFDISVKLISLGASIFAVVRVT